MRSLMDLGRVLKQWQRLTEDTLDSKYKFFFAAFHGNFKLPAYFCVTNFFPSNKTACHRYAADNLIRYNIVAAPSYHPAILGLILVNHSDDGTAFVRYL